MNSDDRAAKKAEIRDQWDDKISRVLDVIYTVIDVPREEAEREAEKFKAQGDMYGWNFHKGRHAGMTEVDLSVREAIRPAIAAELREAYAEIERFKTMSTVEMMCENLNIKHHVEEWERRCLKAEAEIARLLRAALQKAAGFKVDRCACVFIDDEPTLECGYHQSLRAELASIEQFAESWPCHCAENYPGATMYHGQDCQTAIAVEFVAQWRAARVKP